MTKQEEIKPTNPKQKPNLAATHDLLSERELTTKLPPVPISARKCRDIFFLLLFVAYWCVQIGIFIVGYQNGDPRRLIYGSDSNGTVCGGDKKPLQNLVVYPRTAEDVFLAADKITTPWDITFFGICTDSCPKAGDLVCTDAAEEVVQNELLLTPEISRETIIRKCIDNPLARYAPTVFGCADLEVVNGCFDTLFNTTSIFFRCLPLYIYDVELLPESGCTQFKNVSTVDIFGNIKVEQTCVKYREVKKTTIIEPTASDILFDSFNTVATVFNRYLGDAFLAYDVILGCGLGITVIVGFLYMISLWCCIGPIVWASIFGCILASITLTLYCYFKAGIIETDILADVTSTITTVVTDASDAVTNIVDPKAPDSVVTTAIVGEGNNTQVQVNVTESETILAGESLSNKFGVSASYQDQYEIAAYCMTGFSVLLIFVILTISSRISRAIEIFEEAAHAVRHNPGLLMFPFTSVLTMLCAFIFWVGTSAFIASSGTYSIEQLNTTAPVSPNDVIFEVQVFGSFSYNNVLLVFLFFGMLWTINFINGVTIMITSYAVGAWYWGGAPDASELKKTNHWPVLTGIYITYRFHLGTIAFGSVLVAIVQLIRYIAAYVEAKTRDLTEGNKVMKVVLCVIQCFLKCVELCIKFISRNAFIQAAMYGGSFCESTREAFITLSSNLAQVATITFLGDIILRFGQVLVTTVAGLCCWAYLDNNEDYFFGGKKELNSYWFPTLLTVILAWFSVAEVLGIYDIAVDTLLLQFCQDKKLQKLKADHTNMTSQRMESFVDKHDQSKDNKRGRANTNRKSVSEAFGM